jgi:hypothetical protein
MMNYAQKFVELCISVPSPMKPLESTKIFKENNSEEFEKAGVNIFRHCKACN